MHTYRQHILPPRQAAGEKENSVKYLKPYFIFCARVTTLAWQASPLKNLSVLAAVMISALALIACPILLGYGVQRTLENPDVWRQNLAVENKAAR